MQVLSLQRTHVTSNLPLNSREISLIKFTSVRLPHSDKVSSPTNIFMKDILRKVADATSSDRSADTSVNNHLSNSTTANTFCLTLATNSLTTNSQADKPTLQVLNSLKVITSMRDTLRKVADVTSSDKDADTTANNHPSCSRMANTFCTLITNHLVSPKVSQWLPD